MKLTEDVDLEIALCSVASFVVSNVGDIVGSPLKSLTGFKPSFVDDFLNADVVGEDRFVPCHKGRSIGGCDPQIAYKSK